MASKVLPLNKNGGGGSFSHAEGGGGAQKVLAIPVHWEGGGGGAQQGLDLRFSHFGRIINDQSLIVRQQS